MAKYNSVVYGQSTYGQKSRLAFSVSPFTSVALDYGVVNLQWSAPVGGYSAFRLLRNQDAFSSTEEDGVILFEEFGINLDSGGSEISTGVVSISSLTDSSLLDVPTLTPGRYSYYTVWLLKASDKVWYQAGQTYVLVPNPHPTFAPDGTTFKTTHQKFLDLIPRVYSSGSHAPIDEVDLNSDLSLFLKGFSFTVDEFLSELDALLPNHQELKTSPEIVAVKANQLGLPKEGLLSLKNQKHILRDALYVYSTKGTSEALNTIVEDLTGYSTRVSVSPNLMLSAQDSTFYKGLGFWLAQGDCTLSLEDVNPVTSETLSIDLVYSAKVVATSTSAKITNGTDAPVTKGVPVITGKEYSLSFYAQMASSTGQITPSINWYDFQGTLISTSTGSPVTVNTTWDTFSQTATAPAGAVYASLSLGFSAGTYYIDMVQFATSDVLVYNEARCVTIFLDPSKVNHIYNPSFEAENDAWTITADGSITYQTNTSNPRILAGDTVLQLAEGAFTATTSTAAGEVPTGTFVTLSAYGLSTAPTETVNLGVLATTSLASVSYSVTSNVVTIGLRESQPINVGNSVTVSGVDAAIDGTYVVTAATGSSISYSKTTADIATTTATSGTVVTGTETSQEVTFTNSWTRVQMRKFIPGTYLASETTLQASVFGSLTNTLLLDAVQLETNYTATDYVDGNYGTERDAIWETTPNNSETYVYPNKLVNVARLSSEIEKYLPFNTPWIIKTYSGTEASGIS